jgi:hypothetical protein
MKVFLLALVVVLWAAVLLCGCDNIDAHNDRRGTTNTLHSVSKETV